MLNDQRVSISIISILSPYHGLPERQELKGKADEKFEEIKGKASGHLEAEGFSKTAVPMMGIWIVMGLSWVIMGLDIWIYIYVMGYHGFGYWDIYIYIWG